MDNKKIERLRTVSNTDRDGNCYGEFYPTPKSLMEKVNELIERVNFLTDELEKINTPVKRFF